MSFRTICEGVNNDNAFIFWWTISFKGRRPSMECYIRSPCGQVFCLVGVMLAFRQITWPYRGSCLRRERVVVGILAITRGRVRYAARPSRPRAERGIVLRRKCCGPCGRWRVTKYHYICARRLCWQPNDNIELKLQQQWDSLTLLHQEYRIERGRTKLCWVRGIFGQVCGCEGTLSLFLYL